MAYCELTLADDNWRFTIPVAETRSYDETWRHTLSHITEVSGEALMLADQQLGTWMGQAVKEFIAEHGLNPQLVAAHGHTVFHQPERGLTYQMGNGFALQAACQRPVVMNFRNYDVATGGQGAPLVPMGDRLLFGDYDACLNLGGIANVSAEVRGQRVAYDIGVANMVSNYFVQQIGQDYDDNGQLAASGQADQSLITQLNGLDYYAAPFPKSLGYEWVRDHLIRPLEASSLPLPDKLATVTHHATQQIAHSLRQLLNEKKQTTARVLATGGGVFNDYFMRCLRQHSGEAIEYVIPDPQLVSFKEALVFALLGVLRVRGEVNCLSSVTGAAHDHSAGVMYGRFSP